MRASDIDPDKTKPESFYVRAILKREQANDPEVQRKRWRKVLARHVGTSNKRFNPVPAKTGDDTAASKRRRRSSKADGEPSAKPSLGVDDTSADGRVGRKPARRQSKKRRPTQNATSRRAAKTDNDALHRAGESAAPEHGATGAAAAASDSGGSAA